MGRGGGGGSSGAGGKELALRTVLLLEHAVFFVVACRTLNIFSKKGVHGVWSSTFRALRNLPGVEHIIQRIVRKEVEGAVRRLARSASMDAREARRPTLRLPLEGVSGEELLQQLEALKASDRQSLDTGRSLGYVYYTAESGPLSEHCQVLLQAFRSFTGNTGAGLDHDRLVEMAFSAFVCENGTSPTNPALVPAIRKCENEVIAMTASLLHGDEEVVGSLTSGTAESILLVVKTYRDMARANQPQILEPEMVVPITAHPAFVKAGALFGVKCVTVAVGPDKRVSLEAVEAAITPNTILLVASAPQYPHGVVDPIPSLADMAEEMGLPLHVDACVGAFMLPFLEKLGREITRWDFRCTGVTSISADLHKYAYTLKGAGVLLYRSSDIRAFQVFVHTEWPGMSAVFSLSPSIHQSPTHPPTLCLHLPILHFFHLPTLPPQTKTGGVFGSPSLTGSRPGGNVAAAWASMMLLGEKGYLRLAKTTAEVTDRLKEGVRNIGGLGLVAEPEMTCLAILSRDAKVDILLIGDAMEERGWWMERQQAPASLHLSVMPHHKEVCDRFLLDLRASVENVRRRGPQVRKKKSPVPRLSFNHLSPPPSPTHPSTGPQGQAWPGGHLWVGGKHAGPVSPPQVHPTHPPNPTHPPTHPTYPPQVVAVEFHREAVQRDVPVEQGPAPAAPVAVCWGGAAGILGGGGGGGGGGFGGGQRGGGAMTGGVGGGGGDSFGSYQCRIRRVCV